MDKCESGSSSSREIDLENGSSGSGNSSPSKRVEHSSERAEQVNLAAQARGRRRRAAKKEKK